MMLRAAKFLLVAALAGFYTLLLLNGESRDVARRNNDGQDLREHRAAISLKR